MLIQHSCTPSNQQSSAPKRRGKAMGNVASNRTTKTSSPEKVPGRCRRLLNRLKTGKRCVAKDLASELGVSQRTVLYEIRFLQKVGVEIRFDRAKNRYVAMPTPIQAPAFQWERMT